MKGLTMRRLLLVLLIALGACSAPPPRSSESIPTPFRAVPVPGSTVIYPGPHTILMATTPSLPPIPGATNTAVAPAAILSTICVPGYTKTIRPPSSYTNRLKLMQMAPAALGRTIRAPNGHTYPVVGFNLPGHPADYEEDHLISLEADGDPYDPANLYPEPWDGPYGARAKDRVENAVHARLCARTLSLAEGWKILAGKWWESGL